MLFVITFSTLQCTVSPLNVSMAKDLLGFVMMVLMGLSIDRLGDELNLFRCIVTG